MANISNSSHFLSFNQPIHRTSNLDRIVSMWSVLSKCKNHLEDGARLENLSWRLWHQKQQHQSVQPILSLSGGDSCHEVPQEKQTQLDHVPERKGMSISPDASMINNASSIHSNPGLNPDNAPRQTSRTTTPSLSDSYQHEDEDDCEDDDYIYGDEDDDELYDDDDLYDEDDNYIYEETIFMHRRTDKLRSTPNQHYFQKTSPQPLTQQPSLLSALFKTPPNSSSSSSSSSSSVSTSNSLCNTPLPSSDRAPDHFLKKEWTESLRKNVLWEHVQQKPLYTSRRQHSSSFYQYPPPPSYSYQPPTHRYHNHHANNHNNHNRPPFKKTILPSDQGWLESFHGW